MSGRTAESRSVEFLRRRGWSADVVTRWNMYARPHPRRIDPFGFLDLIAVRSDAAGVLGVQATASGNTSARKAKIILIPEAVIWLRAGNRIVIHDWRKVKVKPGGVAIRWDNRITEIVIGDMMPVEETTNG